MLGFIPVIGNIVEKIIDNVFPDPVANAQAKARLIDSTVELSKVELQAQSSIISAEASSEHWLTATWRPAFMWVFLGFVISAWFGYLPPNMPPEILGKMFDMIGYAMCGYVGMRTVEKSVKNVSTILKNR